MLKAVFFDLDGTLLDTSIDLGSALNVVLQHEGKAALPHSVTRAAVSHGANALIKLGFGETLSEARHAELRQMLLEAYLDNIAEHTVAFDGIETLIENLTAKGLKWGIITNKPQTYTTALMPHFHFASQPTATICPDNLTASKPNPEGILLACTLAKVAPHEAIYVGDHERDIIAGKNAGMPTIAVGYGFTDTPHCHKQWGADYNAQEASDIWPIIDTLLQANECTA